MTLAPPAAPSLSACASSGLLKPHAWIGWPPVTGAALPRCGPGCWPLKRAPFPSTPNPPRLGLNPSGSPGHTKPPPRLSPNVRGEGLD